MSFRNSVTIIASPRPRVGKTLLARLVTDFHIHEGRAAAAFDLNDGPTALALFAPGHAAKANIADIKGQMALFDRLVADDDAAKIVDVGHEQFEEFFTQAPRMNASRSLITGVVCGVRVENIEEPIMREIRYLDKLIDELAKGKAMDKILRGRDAVTSK